MFTRVGVSATDMPQSAATGAAVEPARARLAFGSVQAARLRAWRVAGATIRPVRSTRRERNAVERRAVREPRAGSSSGPVGRVPATDIRACDPRTREGPPSTALPARPAWPCRERDGSPAGSRRCAFGSGSMRSTTARPRSGFAQTHSRSVVDGLNGPTNQSRSVTTPVAASPGPPLALSISRLLRRP